MLDDYSFFHVLIFFLTVSLCNLTLWLLYVSVLQGLVVGYWGDQHEQSWSQLLESDKGYRQPWPVVSAAGGSGGSPAIVVSGCQSLRWEWWCPEKTATGEDHCE